MSNRLNARQNRILEIIQSNPCISKQAIGDISGYTKDIVQREVALLNKNRSDGSKYIYADCMNPGRKACWSVVGQQPSLPLVEEVLKAASGPIDYVEIADRTGLTKTRVLTILREFLADELIYEVESEHFRPVYNYAGHNLVSVARYTDIPPEKCAPLLAAGHDIGMMKDLCFLFQSADRINGVKGA